MAGCCLIYNTIIFFIGFVVIGILSILVAFDSESLKVTKENKKTLLMITLITSGV